VSQPEDDGLYHSQKNRVFVRGIQGEYNLSAELERLRAMPRVRKASVHNNCVHQHFNADPERPVRLISAINRIYRHCGLNDLEQLDDAPEYEPGLELDAEKIRHYLRTGTREHTG